MSQHADRDFVIRLQPLADARPAEIRLRRLLKFALRSEKFRCTDIADIPHPAKPAPFGVYSRRIGAGTWNLVHRSGSEQAAHRWLLKHRDRFASTAELTVSKIGDTPGAEK